MAQFVMFRDRWGFHRCRNLDHFAGIEPYRVEFPGRQRYAIAFDHPDPAHTEVTHFDTALRSESAAWTVIARMLDGRHVDLDAMLAAAAEL